MVLARGVYIGPVVGCKLVGNICIESGVLIFHVFDSSSIGVAFCAKTAICLIVAVWVCACTAAASAGILSAVKAAVLALACVL